MTMMRSWAVLALLAASCAEQGTLHCSPGIACPEKAVDVMCTYGASICVCKREFFGGLFGSPKATWDCTPPDMAVARDMSGPPDMAAVTDASGTD